jgi:hypothetical protein
VLEMIGARPPRDLSAGDIRSALGKLVTRRPALTQGAEVRDKIFG